MTIDLVGADGRAVRVADDALQAFRTAHRGPVLDRDAPEYDETRKVWNAMIDRRPGLVARCTGTRDVVHAVRFAREHDLLLSVRGGGHNIAGLAVCEGGLMIDLSPMRGVFVDPRARVARALGGCTLGDVDVETQLHGLAAVLGFVSATGIGGLTVGGGFGYLTRRFGWTCDNVRSMEVVNADGDVVRAAADENDELFWALRGGGGNFGIVTSFEYDLHPVGPQIVGGPIAWRGEDAAEVLERYRALTAVAPRELTCVAVLRIAPPAPWLPKEIHGKPIAAVFVCWTGDEARADEVLAPLRACGRPIADAITRRPYVQMQALLDATQPKGRRYYWKSHYLPGLDPALFDVAVAELARIPSPHSAVILFHLEGALGEHAADRSPAGNRDAQFVLNVAGSWERPDADAQNVEWARRTFEATRAFSTGGAYVNFQTEDEGHDRIEAAYGATTLARLAALKQRYDPGDRFRHNKGFTRPRA